MILFQVLFAHGLILHLQISKAILESYECFVDKVPICKSFKGVKFGCINLACTDTQLPYPQRQL